MSTKKKKRSKSNKRRRKQKCARCGRGTKDGVILTMHHVYHGKKYKHLSDKYGFIITLCDPCHKKLHASRIIDKHVQKVMQRRYEQANSREAFIELMGHSWLNTEDDKEYAREQRLYHSITNAIKDIGVDKTKEV